MSAWDFATMTQAPHFRYLCVRNSWVDRDVMLTMEGKGSRDITGESSSLFSLMEYSKRQVDGYNEGGYQTICASYIMYLAAF